MGLVALVELIPGVRVALAAEVFERVRGGDGPGAQLLAGHPRALLPRIEDVPDPHRPALLGVLNHRRGIIWRDDGEIAVADGAERELARVRHAAGVERGNLVVLHVGAAEE